MDLLIFDKNEKLLSTLPEGSFFNAKHLEKLNGDNVFKFSVGDQYPEIAEGGFVAFRDLDNYYQFFEIVEITEMHADSYTKTATCEHLFYELIHDIVTDKRPSAGATAALSGMLTGTRWQAGIVDNLGNSSTTAYYVSALEAVRNVANAWKGELNWRLEITNGEITARYVDLLRQRGTDTGKQFMYSKDVLNIEKQVDMSGVYTALYGRGKGVETDTGGYGRRLTFAEVSAIDKPAGQEWVGDSTALARWGRKGRHRYGIYTDEEEINPEQLLVKTREALSKCKEARIIYKLDVVDLETLSGYQHEQVRLGDTVRIIDREFVPELLVTARVLELERDLLNPADTKITLGNFAPSIVTSTVNISKQVEDISNRPYNTKWLDGTISILQNQIDNVQSYVYMTPDDGILILNAPTYAQATQALKLGGGMFAIANQKDGTGGWNWRTFGNGAGFTADLLNAGKVKTDLIDLGQYITVDDEGLKVKNGALLKAIIGTWLNGVTRKYGIKLIEGEIYSAYIQSSPEEQNNNRIVLSNDGRMYFYDYLGKKAMEIATNGNQPVIKFFPGSSESIPESQIYLVNPGNQFPGITITTRDLPINLSSDVIIRGNLIVDKKLTVGQQLEVTGRTRMQDDLEVDGNIDATGIVSGSNI